MFTQHSEPNRGVIHLVCDGDVTTADLAGHRRAAVLAARDLGRPFVVLTELTDCVDVSPTAAQELRGTVSHLGPFGLAGELRLVDDDTPEHVVETFDRHRRDSDVELVTLTSRDAVETTLAAHLDRGRC